MDMVESIRVCIIGAGISGLSTAKTFINENKRNGIHYEVAVYEKEDIVGGFWARFESY